MAISYQKLFQLLEEKGWTTYKIRKEKLIGQGTLTALKNGTGGKPFKITMKGRVNNELSGNSKEHDRPLTR